MIEETLKSYENEFVEKYGFSINRQQRRTAKKSIEAIIERELKKQ